MAIINISGTINSSFSTSGVLVNAAQGAGDAIFTIDLRPTHPVINVQDNLDYGVLGWNINDAVATIILVGPQGDVYRNEDYGNPDIVPGTSRYLNKTITLPLDPLQNYANILKGNYTLKISWYNSNLDEYYNFLKTYQYNLDPPSIANTTVSGPYSGVLTSTDTTEYGLNVHQIIREHRIQYPTQLAVPPADVVSSNAEVQVTPIYTNEWNIIISSFVEYRQPDTLRIYWEGSGEFTHCVYGGCIGAMYDAIETMLATYKDAMACNLNNQEDYQKRLVIVNTAWHLLNEAYWTGNTAEADEQSYIIQEQVEYTGSGTCGGASSEIVTPCPPWTGGGVGGTYTFSNGLTEAAGNVVWGGSLTQDVTILMADNTVTFSGLDAGNTVSQVISGSGGILQKASDGTNEGRVYITDTLVTLERADIATPANTRGYEITATGLIEKGDYKAGYVDRQLVAKDYVDLLFAGVSSYTFENGLTNTAGTVTWEGALNKDTTVSPGNHNLYIQGTDGVNSSQIWQQGRGLAMTAFSSPTWGWTGASADIKVQATAAGRAVASMYVYNDNTFTFALISISDLGGITVEDDMHNQGILYVGDYSAVGILNDRWIPDYGAVKAYADSVAGVTVFTGLTDSPADYTGFSEYFVRVNTGETALEFVAAAFVPATGGTFSGQVIISTTTDRPLILRQIGAGSSPGTPEGGLNIIAFQDNDSDEQGYVGIDASGNVILKSWVTGAGILADGNLNVQGDVTLTGAFTVDTINEATANNGVVVDGVTIKDGKIAHTFLPYVFTNGITYATNNVKLGGALTELTTIDASSQDFRVRTTNTTTRSNELLVAEGNIMISAYNDPAWLLTNGYGRVQVTSSYVDMFWRNVGVPNDFKGLQINATHMEVRDDVLSKGLENRADYSANWTDHSLVTKKWIEDNYTATGGSVIVQYGSKQTGVDAGAQGELSVNDDYLYLCTVGGGIGVAIWKRVALSQT